MVWFPNWIWCGWRPFMVKVLLLLLLCVWFFFLPFKFVLLFCCNFFVICHLFDVIYAWLGNLICICVWSCIFFYFFVICVWVLLNSCCCRFTIFARLIFLVWSVHFHLLYILIQLGLFLFDRCYGRWSPDWYTMELW